MPTAAYMWHRRISYPENSIKPTHWKLKLATIANWRQSAMLCTSSDLNLVIVQIGDVELLLFTWPAPWIFQKGKPKV